MALDPASVRNMADLLERSLGAAIKIETRFPLRMNPGLVDANQLELALLNLAINARDAMPNGGTLTISARQVRAGDGGSPVSKLTDFVCISVADSGEGM